MGSSSSSSDTPSRPYKAKTKLQPAKAKPRSIRCVIGTRRVGVHKPTSPLPRVANKGPSGRANNIRRFSLAARKLFLDLLPSTVPHQQDGWRINLANKPRHDSLWLVQGFLLGAGACSRQRGTCYSAIWEVYSGKMPASYCSLTSVELISSPTLAADLSSSNLAHASLINAGKNLQISGSISVPPYSHVGTYLAVSISSLHLISLDNVNLLTETMPGSDKNNIIT